MSLRTSATYEELSSPFFIANKRFCEEFEKFIGKYKGVSDGIYNSWYYHVKGEVSGKSKWKIIYKKEVAGKSLFKLASWECKKNFMTKSKFRIRRKKRFDFIKIKFDDNLEQFGNDSNYMIETNGDKTNLATELYKILKELFDCGEIYEVNLGSDYLKVDLITDKSYFQILTKLINKI